MEKIKETFTEATFELYPPSHIKNQNQPIKNKLSSFLEDFLKNQELFVGRTDNG